MKTIEIKAKKREKLGKTATKKLRKQGNMPCVLYGGDEVVHFYATPRDFKDIIYTPSVYLLKLNIDGQVYDAILQDIQFHPVSDDLLHLDFVQIREDKPVIIKVPVKLKGLAKGVQAGGKLLLEQRKIKVRALPKDLPDFFELDITDIELGQSIKIRDLDFENIEQLNAKDSVVASVKLTRMAKPEDEEAEGEEGAEGQEGEEGAEGEEKTAEKTE